MKQKKNVVVDSIVWSTSSQDSFVTAVKQREANTSVRFWKSRKNIFSSKKNLLLRRLRKTLLDAKNPIFWQTTSFASCCRNHLGLSYLLWTERVKLFTLQTVHSMRLDICLVKFYSGVFTILFIFSTISFFRACCRIFWHPLLVIPRFPNALNRF